MKISISFYSLKNLSDISNGQELLNILSSYGLVIEKAGEYEPIRKDFAPSDLPEIWKGRCDIDSSYRTCSFLFKGKGELRFSGMASWSLNIHPNSKSFEGVHLWLNVPRKYDISKLIRLADDLFIWSEAVYGYITENSKKISKIFIKKNNHSVSIGNVYSGIPSLMWLNYFGPPYLNETDFHLPNDNTRVGHGIRLVLTETPNDERLSNLNFLKSYIDYIGAEWFFQFEKIDGEVGVLKEGTQSHTKRIPVFDNSAIVRRF